MSEKREIIQIIPNTKKVYAICEDDNHEYFVPIICYALTDRYLDGKNVVAMINDGVGNLIFVDEISNFKCIHEKV